MLCTKEIEIKVQKVLGFWTEILLNDSFEIQKPYPSIHLLKASFSWFASTLINWV